MSSKILLLYHSTNILVINYMNFPQQFGKAHGCTRCDNASVTSAGAIDFYLKQGAVDLTAKEGWWLMKLPKESMEKMVVSVAQS